MWFKYTKSVIDIALIAHDIRSCHNVGSLLRTADGLGVQHICLTGYTPYPKYDNDPRLPHIANKVDRQIRKTALGAESSAPWQHIENIHDAIDTLRDKGFKIVGLEQHDNAIQLPKYTPPNKIALLLGREAEGLAEELINTCDELIEIPMFGQKESFNVVQAAAIVLSQLRY